MLYDDALRNGWTSGGWNANVDLGSTAQVHASSKAAAAVQFTGTWGAWTLANATPVSTSGYDALTFWAYGGSGGNTLQIVVKSTQSGTETGRKQGIQLAAGTWQQYTVPLSEVGNPAQIGEVWVHDATGGAQSTFYVNDLRLTTTASNANVLYDDALRNDWASGGWSANIDLRSTTQVHAGRSAAAAVQLTGTWGAWTLSRANPLATTGLTALKFWAYGGSGGNSLQIVFKSTQGQGGTETGRKTVQVAAGAWQEYTVTLSEVGNPAQLGEVWVQDATDGSQSTFYINDLRLVGASNDLTAATNARQASTATLEVALSAFPNPSPKREATTLELRTQTAQRATIRVQGPNGLVGSFALPVQAGRTLVKLPYQLVAGTYYVQTVLDGRKQTFRLAVE